MSNTLARIDLAVFRENVEKVRAHLPADVEVLFPVKSDAYGHGIEAVSRVAAEIGLHSLGVATLEEGRRVREAGVSLPVLLLAPILPSEVPLALELRLTPQVADLDSAQAISRAAQRAKRKAPLHVNVNTGMRRFGVLPERAVNLLARARELPFLEVEGIFSHLSVADSESPSDQAYTLGQIERFASLLAELEEAGLLPPLRHIANSAAAIQYTDEVTRPPLNLVRIATLFYGYPEVRRPWAEEVRPVATLTAPVIALKDLAPGDFVGYGRAYRASRRERIAVLPIGYASGFNPRLAQGGEVFLRDRRAPVVGRICLDHTLVDVSEIEGVSIGDDAEVFGPNLPADRAAARAGLAVCELLVPALRGARGRTYV